jgi:murein DD-endopeptidase MepM/ murein hydrolase activator NlpD
MPLFRQERLTVLVIPEAGGRTFEYKFPRIALLGAAVVALAVGVLLVAGFWFFVQAGASGRQVDRLQREKRLLSEEVKRIGELEGVLLQLQRSNQQLRTILGESVRAKEEPERVRGQTRYESYVEPHDRLRWGHLRTFPGLWPAPGVVIEPFDERSGGLVIAVPSGTLVRAAGAGQVSRSGYDEQLGHLVQVDHGGGLVSVYGYARQLLVEAGDYVEKGQPLALSGRSGKARTASLFYAVRANRRPLNPSTIRLWL